MKTPSSQAVFVRLTVTLKRLETQGDIGALQRLLVSDGFARDLLVLTLTRRHQIMMNAAALLTMLKERIGPLVPFDNDKSHKWTEARIAKLRALDAEYGDDELIARAMGMPRGAVVRARFRYVGSREMVALTTADAGKAA